MDQEDRIRGVNFDGSVKIEGEELRLELI